MLGPPHPPAACQKAGEHSQVAAAAPSGTKVGADWRQRAMSSLLKTQPNPLPGTHAIHLGSEALSWLPQTGPQQSLRGVHCC